MDKECYLFDLSNSGEDDLFEIQESLENHKVFVLIIYDIIDNKKRQKLSKFLLGYGFRIQKSAFEAVITKKKYNELLQHLPAYAGTEDSIRVYKMTGRGQAVTFGKKSGEETEDLIII